LSLDAAVAAEDEEITRGLELVPHGLEVGWLLGRFERAGFLEMKAV
jgi:hypothetical protein